MITTMKSTVVLTALLAASVVHAQSESDYAQRIGQLVEAQCPAFAAALTSRPEIAPILQVHPLSTVKVCDCTTKSFVSDARLRDALNVQDSVLSDKLRTEPLRSYMTMRLMTSVLACLAPEMEQSLSAASLR